MAMKAADVRRVARVMVEGGRFVALEKGALEVFIRATVEALGKSGFTVTRAKARGKK